MTDIKRQQLWWLAAAAVLVIGGYFAWSKLGQSALPAGIAAGNGRIEATEIDISALAAGRISEIMVKEGDFVEAGDVLVQMDVVQLNAQKRQAEAQLRRAQIGVETANSLVVQATAERKAAKAVVAQHQAQYDAAASRLARSEQLVKTNAISQQTLDDDRAAARQAEAGLAASEASLAAADAGIGAAKAQVVDARAAIEAAQASIDAITASINDSTLTSPRSGRVQYRVAQEGEIVSAGGRILNLVDLSDVYMTFFLPTSQAGRVQIGTEVRLVLDAAAASVIPATVSYVADVAQFTPKTVETAEEREKLMFRIRARIDPDLLKKYIRYVKTGLPGVAYLRLDPDAPWPEFLGSVAE
ncbi:MULTISPECIES: HlyD family secretion protein [Actibacterium]|uniref:HlyD family secretion protein n=1 Tax=Actibacterium naphthalenivorans TaxID=1614693 RepID=A0A840CE77_9RHOB|nr:MULTISPECIES: HlyD family efflux transporter periplasmic adaptor subunit [Actibacterium]ALG90437.1 glycoside hydrolase family 43 [Actibacterium sp. EMB200-NS6]MBB4022382.1 HlyD family secretion protein [Actibacterium naphthalenivorans]